MSEDGYKQAIENVMYEIDRMAEDVDSQSGHPVVKALSLIGGGASAELIEERVRKLDKIVTVIANTYHRTEAEVDKDIDEAHKKRTNSCPT